ncbi:MAG: hypothetical protein ACFB0A_14330 [Croceivirga sp.]
MQKLFKSIPLFLVFTISVQAQQDIQVKTLIKKFPGNGAITVDGTGNILVNEYGLPNADISGNGKRIFLVKPDGDYQVLLDDLNGPIGGVFDAKGSFYFNNGSSYTNSDLMRFTDGKLKKIATIPGFSADMVISKSTNDIIVTNYTKPILYKVDTKGNVLEFIKDDRLKGCTGITYGEDETIFVSNFSTGKIFKIENESTIVEFAAVPIEYPGYVIGYITYFNGNIYATGYGASKIYKIGIDGNVTLLAGSGERKDKDGNQNKAGFFVPNGIEIDKKKKRLYISQNGNGQPKSLRYIDLSK